MIKKNLEGSTADNSKFGGKSDHNFGGKSDNSFGGKLDMLRRGTGVEEGEGEREEATVIKEEAEEEEVNR